MLYVMLVVLGVKPRYVGVLMPTVSVPPPEVATIAAPSSTVPVVSSEATVLLLTADVTVPALFTARVDSFVHHVIADR